MAEIQEISTEAKSESEDVGENQIHATIADDAEGEEPAEAAAAAAAAAPPPLTKTPTTPTTAVTTPTSITAATTPTSTTAATLTTGSENIDFLRHGQKRHRPTRWTDRRTDRRSLLYRDTSEDAFKKGRNS